MRLHTRRRRVAAACTAAAAVALLTLGSGGSVGAAENDPSPDPAASLALLRQAPTAEDRISPVDRPGFRQLAEDRQLDLSGSRVTEAEASAGPVRLIPGEDAVCVALPDPVDGNGVGCRSIAEAEQGRLWTGLVGMPGQDVGDARVAIVVPDGVSSIETVDQRGVRTEQTPHENLVVANLRDVAAYELAVDGVQIHQPIAGTPPELVAP